MGGSAELPDIARTKSTATAHDAPLLNYFPAAFLVGAAVLALGGGAWYVKEVAPMRGWRAAGMAGLVAAAGVVLLLGGGGRTPGGQQGDRDEHHACSHEPDQDGHRQLAGGAVSQAQADGGGPRQSYLAIDAREWGPCGL